MCETTTTQDGARSDRTVWPWEDLTVDVTDAYVGGRVVKTLAHPDRIVIESIMDSERTIRIDISQCKIGDALLDMEIDLVGLSGIKTIDMDYFFHVCADQEAFATVYTTDQPHDEQWVRPGETDDDPEYEIGMADRSRSE